MAEDKKISVTVQNAGIEDENLKKFQKLLAYFVWHLEYMNGDYTGGQKFCEDDKKTILDRGKSGQGYKGDSIQKCIERWELLKDGRVFISARCAQRGNARYFALVSYLHWAGEAGNVSIYVNANEAKQHIESIYIADKWIKKDNNQPLNVRENNTKEPYEAKYSLKELGIQVQSKGYDSDQYDTNTPDVRANLQNFYNAFVYAAGLERKSIVENAKNIIFTGAPGTGKTYLAKQIAKQMGAQYEFVQFHPSYDYTDFVEGLRPVVKETNNSNNIEFERKDGIFKAFCEKALKQWLLDLSNDENYHSAAVELTKTTETTNQQKGVTKEQEDAIAKLKEEVGIEEKDKNVSSTPQNFVFIIDEINRGEISKIFGELFFSVDPGYRGVSGAVKTQYANLQEKPNLFDLVLLALEKIEPGDWGHFFIPENVYIIGTMNDIDRSVESMDFAFRRRFTFKEIKAKDTQAQILNSIEIADEKKKLTVVTELVRKMDELNKAIYDPVDKSNDSQTDFSEAYHIGAAYFKHYSDYAKKEKPDDKLWDNHLKGVLFEYLRGKPNANDILDKWHIAYDNGLLSVVAGFVDFNKMQEKLGDSYDSVVEEIEKCIRENKDATAASLKEAVLNIEEVEKKETKRSKKGDKEGADNNDEQ